MYFSFFLSFKWKPYCCSFKKQCQVRLWAISSYVSRISEGFDCMTKLGQNRPFSSWAAGYFISGMRLTNLSNDISTFWQLKELLNLKWQFWHQWLVSTLYYFLLLFELLMRLACIISSPKSIIKLLTPLMLKHHLTWIWRLKWPHNTCLNLMGISKTLRFIIFKTAMVHFIVMVYLTV